MNAIKEKFVNIIIAATDLMKSMFNVIRLKGTPEDNVLLLLALVITIIIALIV